MQRTTPYSVDFFETAGGNQPVREFLLDRSREDKKEIGGDIYTVQQGFPMGLPLVEKPLSDLWEIRSHIPDGICRIFFTICDERMILLHAFVKKTRKTPKKELAVASARLKEFKNMYKAKEE
jgi:phage-related protein